jgi:hypothetical protein
VFVQPFPQRTSRWQISTQGGNYPRWARTGKELFYFTEDGTLMSVDVQADGTALKASTPRVLFKSNVMFGNHNRVGGQLDMPYDVSADGQRFLINERLVAANQNTPITVVLNWAAALKNSHSAADGAGQAEAGAERHRYSSTPQRLPMPRWPPRPPLSHVSPPCHANYLRALASDVPSALDDASR